MKNHILQDLNLAGVKWELTEEPAKTAVKKAPVQQNFPSSQPCQNQPVIIPAAAPVTLDTVKSMVTRPSDTDSLVRMICEFNHPLRGGATNPVKPNIASKPNGLLIITDLPSADDDLSGNILSGNAGEMTDKMLNAIEMSRENVSIVPLLFWRTPGGRTPLREELDLSRPFVDKLIEMLNPRVIITFGTLATTEIAKTNLNDSHGDEIQDEKGCIIVPLYHPNYLILKPSAKKDVWVALQNIQKLLKTA
ncbi:MAG: uracil-DNA glycosylase [Alphaproteobacteria bacterium]|nr:uracil-DNA glycosylase [Alphaproteobacteria bacterium]